MKFIQKDTALVELEIPATIDKSEIKIFGLDKILNAF